MKVEVIAKEIVKPSTPTPHHLQTIQLSSLDHFATSNYLSIILFYKSGDSHQLKTSLSHTLTHFYPMAGRIKDNLLLDCNDQGVDFLDAIVHCQLKEFLDQVNVDDLDHFLPCELSLTEAEMSTKPLLSVQVNTFECGGIGLCICFSHKLGDGVSMATFINGWAAVSRGVDEPLPGLFFGFSSHFPLTEESKIMPTGQGTHPSIVTRRFVFNASNIAALREFVSSSNNLSTLEHPTRVELVSTLLWWRTMALADQGNKRTTVYGVVHAVNLRRKMVPMLSKEAFGNVSRPTITRLLKGEVELEYHELVGLVRDSIGRVDEKYVTALQCGNEGFMNYIAKAKQEEFSEFELVLLNFSSWCRFPLHEADFGWGTPIWVATTKYSIRNFVILMDTRLGDGTEAWVNMHEKDMDLLEHDQVFLSFVSSIDK